MSEKYEPNSKEMKKANFLEATTDFSQLTDTQRKEFWASLALKHTEGLGLRGISNLVKEYGSAYSGIQNTTEWKSFGIHESAINAFKADAWRESAGKEWALAKKPNTQILLWTNPYYPNTLKEIPDPPLFLYFRGNIELLSNPGVGVVGARRASSDALAASFRVGIELSKVGVTVVSGLARGVDSEAHKAALEGLGSTVAVLGCGLDINYPPENKILQEKIGQTGLLLSEYHAGIAPEAFHFPVRNRLISGISLGVLVVEAASRSGSLITARLALEYGREVFAMPGKFAASKAQGSHDLIRRGAKPVLELDDMLIELLPRLKSYVDFGQQALVVSELVETAEENRKRTSARKQKKDNSGSPQETDKKENTQREMPKYAGAAPSAYRTESERKNDLATNILHLLESEGPLQADSICALLKISASKMSSEILMLELDGKIKRYPGMIYALT